jgi:hypothetical protein
MLNYRTERNVSAVGVQSSRYERTMIDVKNDHCSVVASTLVSYASVLGDGKS